MNFQPVVLGVVTFIIIGLFHPLIIKAEYYFSYKIWPIFGAVGLVLLAITFFLDGFWAYVLAVAGITCLWSVIEFFHQKKRVEKGWFPKNPNRKE